MGAGVGVWDEFNEVEIWTGGRSMLSVNSLLFEICLCPPTRILGVIVLLEAVFIWIVLLDEQ